MSQNQKTKNYAELNDARVFHNPKTDLIEITGKYVDGGNFSVVLPKGTKSDAKVRIELPKQIHGVFAKTEPESETSHVPTRKLHYSNPGNVKLVKSGGLYYQVDAEENWFCLPELSPGSGGLFPLGVNENGKPIVIDLKPRKAKDILLGIDESGHQIVVTTPAKRNIFLSNHPGSGGLVALANLVHHVINFMPETKIVYTNHEIPLGILPTDTKAEGRMELLKKFWLLEHLRDLREKMNSSHETASPLNEIIILQDLEILVDGEIENGPSSRTDKAVRAEILNLIMEISHRPQNGMNIQFVFQSSYLSESMNAFLDTSGTIMAFTRHPKRFQNRAEISQYRDIFGRNLNEMYGGLQGRGVVKDNNDDADSGQRFALFENPAVMESFADHNTQQIPA